MSTTIFILHIFMLPLTLKPTSKMKGLSPLDPSSFSRPELAVVTDLKIALTVDFERKVLRGNVDVYVEKKDPKAQEVFLDSKGLKIKEIYEVDLADQVKFTLDENVGAYGSKLSIELPEKNSPRYIFNIHYETSPTASGLQWLDAIQTTGKQHPYLFSQFQAIHARSVIPCQDTPAVKTPYTALITVPKELTAIMSAIRNENKQTSDSSTSFFFVQKIPIPAYLIALAVGALESRRLGPRSKVWAEKEVVEKAAYEFADTEKQLKTAEDICGPYVWQVYDLLILPPSFPFGGMENPCLTFVTPTLLAGDKSLANVVAHEIAHSWTGNLVTNRNFEHFWLNEGFTMFVERKIVGRLVSEEEQDFEAYCGKMALKETVDFLGDENPLTRLVVDLTNVHPDDSFSKIPYEKGYIFLRYLEVIVGGPNVFEQFLRVYFDYYKYKSIDTNDFKSYFNEYFADNPCIQKIDWESWLYKPGMPTVIPAYNTKIMEVCITYKKRLLEWEETNEVAPFTKDEIKNMSANMKIQLLQEIYDEAPQNISKLQAIEKLFHLKDVKNCEIKFRWLRIGLKAHWKEKVQPTLDWLNTIGRMKYVRPLYRDLYDWEEVRNEAILNFEGHKHTMMHVVSYTLAQDLHLVT